MADYGKLNFSVAFNPTSAFPLDARSYFESYADALSAARSAQEVGSSKSIYHYGQTLAVVEDGVATLYVIQPDKTLKTVGSVLIGDGKSIEITDGNVTLAGFEEAEEGQQPRIRDGKLEWLSQPIFKVVDDLPDDAAEHPETVYLVIEDTRGKDGGSP